jgi:hypothetical protein
MKSVPEILEWIRSHPDRFRRSGYTPPNHLANGRIQYFGHDIGATFSQPLDTAGNARDYKVDPPPSRIEIYGGDGALLYAEDA